MPCVRSPRLCARVMERRSRSSSASALRGDASKTACSRSISASMAACASSAEAVSPSSSRQPRPPAMALHCSPLWPLTPRTARIEMPSSRPGARGEGQAQHGPQYIRVARFAPDDAADLGIDIGGHERGDGGVVTGQAEGEVVLQLLPGAEAGRRMFSQLARMRRKPSGEWPSSMRRPGSAAGRRGSRNGAVLRTCAISVSGPIHWAQASRGGLINGSGQATSMTRRRTVLEFQWRCNMHRAEIVN